MSELVSHSNGTDMEYILSRFVTVIQFICSELTSNEGAVVVAGVGSGVGLGLGVGSSVEVGVGAIVAVGDG